MNIGTVDLGKSATASIVVTNTGTGTSGSVIATPGANVTVSGCTGALIPKGTCTLTITATPTMIGAFSSSVSISANPGATTPILISVLGSVSQPGQFSVLPTVVELGPVVVGVPAAPQTIKVTAANALTDLIVTPSGASVSIDKNASTCTAALAAGASCMIVVNFTAATSGQKSDAIVITAGGAAGKTITVPVNATALKPAQLVVTPSVPQAFATTVGTPSSAIAFGVANGGDIATGQVKYEITSAVPADAADFVATSTCTILAPLGTCAVSVVFNPKAYSATAKSATLTISDSTGTSQVAVLLSGTTYNPTALVITPATADLGTVKIGETSAATVYTITNNGDSASGALTVTLSSTEFTITNDACTGTSLAKNGTCTVSVALKPLTVGAKSANLVVTPAGGNAAVKMLTGTALSVGKLEAAPVSLDFGSVRINRTGTAQSFVITNKGGTATGALTITKSGSFGEFPVTASSCSAALAPAGTCTVTVNFAPLTAGSKTASYTVTDGASTATVTVAGTALDAAGISVSPSPVPACSSLPQNSEQPCFNDTVINGVGNTITFTVSATTLPAGVADTGAIAATLTGDNAAEFTITANQCTSLLQGATCTIAVAFNPTATGLRQATLSVTSANGGNTAATLQGVGLAIVEIQPILDEEEDPATVTGYDFGQVPLLGVNTNGHQRQFRVVVRGPNTASVSTTTAQIVLADPSQPADFSYPTALVNPCNGADNMGAELNFATGARSVNAWTPDTAPNAKAFSCTFTVRFYPQSSKGAKTSTLTATSSGTGGGTDTKTLTGTASGLLTFTPDSQPYSFGNVANNTSTNDVAGSVTMLSGTDLVITLNNNSGTTPLGPIVLELGGANADQFIIVQDLCSTTTLAANGHCNVGIAFAPTSVGAKTATLTASGGGETTSAVINGTSTTGYDITVAPAQLDFGTIAQTAESTWMTVTVTNPASSPKSAQISYSTTNSRFVVANGANHALGTCGLSGSTALPAGSSCTILVQFIPTQDDAVGVAIAGINSASTDPTVKYPTLNVVDEAKSDYTVKVPLIGKPSAQLTISPTSHTFADTAEGLYSAQVTLTVTNNGGGTNASTLAVTSNTALAPFDVVTESTTCVVSGTLAPGATCILVLRFHGQVPDEEGDYPVDEATFPKTLTVNVSGKSATAATATLSGKTVRPAKLVALGVENGEATHTINLGAIRRGQQSGQVTLRYQNVGSVATDALTYKWDNLAENTQDAEFKIVSETSTGCVGRTSLGAGEICTVTIYFQPTSTGALGARDAKGFTLSANHGGVVSYFALTASALDPDNSAWIAVAGGANGFLSSFSSMVSAAAPGSQLFQLTNSTGAGYALSSLAVASVSLASDNDEEAPAWVVDATNTGGTNPCSTVAVNGLIPAGATCTFKVTYTPTAAPIATSQPPTSDDQATWAANPVYRWATIGTGAAKVGVFAQAQTPARLKLTLADTAFGEVQVGVAGSKAFTVQNIGQTASAAVVMTPGGASAGIMEVTGTCTAALAPNATCTGTVSVTPIAVGAISGTLQAVAGAANSGAPVALTGSGVNPTILTLSATSASFGNVAVAATSSTTTITLNNASGSATSPVLTAVLSDTTNFVLVATGASDCVTGTNYGAHVPPVGVAGAGSCTVGVAFKPAALTGNGAMTGTLTIGGKTVNLSGTAISALSITSPSSPATVTTTQVVTVSLSSSVDEGFVTPFLRTTISGGGYRVIEDQCVANKLMGGDTCQITVQMIGTAATPRKTGTLTVTGGSAGTTATLELQSAAP